MNWAAKMWCYLYTDPKDDTLYTFRINRLIPSYSIAKPFGKGLLRRLAITSKLVNTGGSPTKVSTSAHLDCHRKVSLALIVGQPNIRWSWVQYSIPIEQSDQRPEPRKC